MYKILLFMMMMLGSIVSITSNNWLSMWVGLEMNMLSFIPLMYKSKNFNSTESSMMYFLIQSMGSIIMFMSIIINMMIMVNINYINNTLMLLLIVSLMIKLGIPPFHMWFVEISIKMNWPLLTILMTWQKIAPLWILSNLMLNNMFLQYIVLMSATIGALGGLNQTSVKKLMSFSSINHMAWMIACMKFNNMMWMMYLLMYTLLMLMIVYTFIKENTNYINQLYNSNKSFMKSIYITTTMLSLGGMPPLMGFIPKWMIIKQLMFNNSYFMLFILIMSSLITLFYYMRMISSILLISSNLNKWTEMNKENELMLMTIILINVVLPLMLNL
nr:NADH dehydrogenase subunit 2 [Ischnobaenella hainana]